MTAVHFIRTDPNDKKKVQNNNVLKEPM